MNAAAGEFGVPEYSSPTVTRSVDGHVSIDWGRRGYKRCTLVADVLIDEWIAEKNELVDLRAEVARLTTETEQLRAARAVLETPDLVRWLDRYGDGPPALMGDEDEVIWRLAGFLQSARAAAGDGDPQ